MLGDSLLLGRTCVVWVCQCTAVSAGEPEGGGAGVGGVGRRLVELLHCSVAEVSLELDSVREVERESRGWGAMP